MYEWWKFIHLVGVVGFMAAHGTSMAATFLVRRLRDPAKISGVLQLSGATVGAFYVFTLLLLLGGIAAGLSGGWFSRYWIWISLVVFVAIAAMMFFTAKRYFDRVRKTITLIDGGTAVSDGDFDAILRSGQPTLVIGTGAVGILFIVYLMVLKPF